MLITEGFNRGINSYAELIPETVFGDPSLKSEDGESIIEHFEEVSKNLDESNPNVAYYIADFINDFLYNRATQLDSIKAIDDLKDAKHNRYYLYDGNIVEVTLGEAGPSVKEVSDYNKTMVKGLYFDFLSNEKVVQVMLEANKDLIKEGKCNGVL